MVKRPKTFGLALVCCGTLMAGAGSHVHAATSATSDILFGGGGGESGDTVDFDAVKPLPRPNRGVGKPSPSGNPLWSIPLSVLTATHERPIFSASRRPPQRAVVAPVDQVIVPVVQKTAEPQRPPLALIGAVVGDSDAIAIFLDRTNQKIVRLRQGESHAGWELSSVMGREVTLKKADQAEVLTLKGLDASPPSPIGVPGVPGVTLPVAGSVGMTYAPFVPRSTPKNGESDGL